MSTQDLELWAKLKLVYLDPAFSGVYTTIGKHYEKYGKLPSFNDFDYSLRESSTIQTIETLKIAEAPDVSIEVVLDALIDQFTQNETIKQLDKFIDKLPQFDTAEIKQNLSNIVLTLDEKTYSAQGVYSMSDIMLFRSPEEISKLRVHLGLNNTFDAVLGGMAKEEYLLIGGKRGSGKSITAANILVNQYESGNTAAYFTIEMTGHETLERVMAIHSNVSHRNLKKGLLTDTEVLSVVKARANMFLDSEELVKEYIKNRDRYKFEESLVRQCKLKPDNQMIIIDDRALTLTALDMHLGKIKSKFGDKFTVAVVDYINQIVIEGVDKYDWKPQITVSTKLKDLARKYEIVMVSPYQIDATGEARFAKGILDAADVALIMEAHEHAMSFETTKIRGDAEMNVTSGINWDTLRISPQNIEKPETKEKIKKAGKPAQEEKATDLPWDA